MKTEKQKKKKTKYVTDNIDVLQFGKPLGGSYYTSQSMQGKYMKSYGSSMIVNGIRLIQNE
jgi:hypothetical protein